jgi:3-phenylpropionate/trans-cinnamate dioxygenase ferredoxin reductase subunit
MSDRRVLIVGAGAAGDGAAEALRKAGFDGSVVLVGRDPQPAYHRPYLSKQYLRGELPIDRVRLRQPDDYGKLDIEWLGERSAVAASRADSTVTLDDGRTLRFDTLVLATGGRPRWPDSIPRLDNVFALRTLADAASLKEALDAAHRPLIVGAGFIGAEVAASACMLGKEPIMVELAPVPLGRALSEDVGQVYARIHRDRGVDLRVSTSVTEWIADGSRVAAVRLSDGPPEDVDLVLVAVGIEPELALAHDLDLPVEAGGIAVDDALRAADGIYCAGDIAAHLHPVFGRRLRVEHWQVARKQGQAVGEAIAGEPSPYHELPWFWSDQYDVNLQYLGQGAGFDQVVWRGDPEGEKFSVFYLRKGLVEAVLAMNEARTIRFTRELIASRSPVAPEVLADEGSDLRELARQASAQRGGS